MNLIAPSNKLIDESGGSMVFAIPMTNIEEVQPLFKLIELADKGEMILNKSFDEQDYQGKDSLELDDVEETQKINPYLLELKTYLKDCGISHTTLEEVFMKVTGKKISKYVR